MSQITDHALSPTFRGQPLPLFGGPLWSGQVAVLYELLFDSPLLRRTSHFHQT